jgi:hypothetical protein
VADGGAAVSAIKAKTVHELIEALRAFPEHLPVFIESSSGEYNPVQIEQAEVWSNFAYWDEGEWRARRRVDAALVLTDEPSGREGV